MSSVRTLCAVRKHVWISRKRLLQSFIDPASTDPSRRILHGSMNIGMLTIAPPLGRLIPREWCWRRFAFSFAHHGRCHNDCNPRTISTCCVHTRCIDSNTFCLLVIMVQSKNNFTMLYLPKTSSNYHRVHSFASPKKNSRQHRCALRERSRDKCLKAARTHLRKHC